MAIDAKRWHVRSSTPAAVVTFVTLVGFLPAAVGCTSNEYVIPHEELARLAATPPMQRGARVRVIQELGDRRSDPVPVTVAPPEEPPPVAEDESRADLQINISDGGSRGGSAYGTGSGGRVVHGGGGHGAGFHGGGGGGGGGGGNGDAALIVLIVVVAVVVAIGLVSSEGVRFDGFVAMSPAQPVHLRGADGREATLPIADLSPELAAGVVEAKVMDDEGYGISRLDGAPLDRRGGVFKLDSGTIAFGVPGGAAVGPAMDVQVGLFVTRRVGLLLSLGLAGAGTSSTGGLIPRHALGAELEALPWEAGRLHVGLFAGGGMALTETFAGGVPTTISGPSMGGGALAELDVTSRMALTLRAGGSVAKLDRTWTPAGLVTAGVAVY
ncbi:MAG TPA: hypothetical protein VN962_28055 [Polyangia bacterium]|nr:hypothetical protein [Polyangia bacterium]